MNSNDISSEIVKQKIRRFFVDRFENEDINITFESCTKHGDNFSGLIHRVIGQNNKNKEKLSIILKCAPSNPIRREQYLCRIGFVKEIIAYNEVTLFEMINMN